MRVIRVIFWAILLLAPAVSYAWQVPLRSYPNCPGANPAAPRWQAYFSKEIAGGEAGKAIVQFSAFRGLNDPQAINGLDPKACYMVWYQTRTKTWNSLKSTDPHTMSNLPGDPLENEINVHGVLFGFKDQNGEIFNTKGDVVGRLVCYQSNECASF
jgi:hypothetical protein